MKIGILVDIFDRSKNPLDFYYFSQIINQLDQAGNDITLFCQNELEEGIFLDITTKNWNYPLENLDFLSKLEQLESEEFDVVFLSSNLNISKHLIKYKASGIGFKNVDFYIHLSEESDETIKFYKDLNSQSIHILSHTNRLKGNLRGIQTHFLPFPIKKNFEPETIKNLYPSGIKLVFPLTIFDVQLVFDTALFLYQHRHLLDTITRHKGICFHFMQLNDSAQAERLKQMIEQSEFKDISTIERITDLSLKNISAEKNVAFLFASADSASSLHLFECLLKGAPTFLYENSPLKEYFNTANSKEFILPVKGWNAAQQISKILSLGIHRPSLADNFLTSRKYWSNFFASLRKVSNKSTKQPSKGVRLKFAILADKEFGLTETIASVTNSFGQSAKILVVEFANCIDRDIDRLKSLNSKNLTFFSDRNFIDLNTVVDKDEKVFLLRSGDRLDEDLISTLEFNKTLLGDLDGTLFGYYSGQKYFLPPIFDEDELWFLLEKLNTYPAILNGDFFLKYLTRCLLEVKNSPPIGLVKLNSIPISILRSSTRQIPFLNKRVTYQNVANAFYGVFEKLEIDMKNINSYFLGIKSQETDS